jgi:hypothetical protein
MLVRWLERICADRNEIKPVINCTLLEGVENGGGP